MKLVYGYSRVSTEKQAREGTSLESQEKAEKDYFDYRLAGLGFQWGGWIRDGAQSGAVPLTCRPGGAQLAALLEAGDAVVFARLDRGFRSLKDMLHTLEIWQQRGVQVFVLDISVDTTTAVGKLILSVIAAVAEFERKLIHERTQLGRQRRHAQGYRVDGKPPYGWTLGGVRGKRKFVRDPRQRLIGRRLLELRRQGKTFEQIFWVLHKEGLTWAGRDFGMTRIRNWIAGEEKLQAQDAAEVNAATKVDAAATGTTTQEKR